MINLIAFSGEVVAAKRWKLVRMCSQRICRYTFQSCFTRYFAHFYVWDEL